MTDPAGSIAQTPELLRIVVAGDGPHLFAAMNGEAVRLLPPSDADARVDAVVFPCGTDRKFERVTIAQLPASLRQAIRDRQAGVIFDASAEGVAHSADRTDRLHRAFGSVGATPSQCIYITQDRSYAGQYAEHCDEAGLGERAAVLEYDYWIWQTLADLSGTGAARFEEGLARFHARASHRPRRFVSLNRTPRPGKIVFLLRLLHDGLWDQGFISFGGFREPDGKSRKPRPTSEQLAARLPGFDDLIATLAPRLDDLEAKGGTLLTEDSAPATRVPTFLAVQPASLSEYAQSWFTVVTETEMRPRFTRITEKVLKPLLNFQPMLVLGNPGALRLVRELGFETFGGIYDESYDEISDVRQRFEAVYEQVARLCRAPEAELREMEARVRETLVANARLGLTVLPRSGRVQHARHFIQRIREAL